jgi:hypothetical protein
MKPEVRAINTLFAKLTSVAEHRETGGEVDARDIETALEHALGGFPRQVIEILTGFTQNRFESDAIRAPLLVSTYVGILLQQYDGTPLTLSEWHELRDLVSDCADELDMDIIAYAMSLLMDNGALLKNGFRMRAFGMSLLGLCLMKRDGCSPISRLSEFKPSPGYHRLRECWTFAAG